MASRNSSWRKAASDRVTATRPFQLLITACQIRSTPAAHPDAPHDRYGFFGSLFHIVAAPVYNGFRMKAAEMFSLKGRVALVTGASSGLGAQFARALADNGAAVALVARRADRLKALKDEIEGKGGKAVAIEADVTDRAAMTRAFDAAEKAFGTVTILVNNAGIAHGGRAVEMPPEEWRKVLSTNLDAVFFWAQEAARRMLAAKKQGAIVNIASVLGLAVAKGAVAYATAKAGVVQVTKALAVELAFKGVRVNAIAPGWFVTEINDDYLASEAGTAIKREIPMGRFGNAGDLDGALLLLASDAGSYITGATIVVDGGQVVQIKGREDMDFTLVARDRGSPPARARLRGEGGAAAGGRSGKFLRARKHPGGRGSPRCARRQESRALGAAVAEGIRRHGPADRRLGGDLRGSRALDLRPARHQLHGAGRRQHEPAQAGRHAGAEGKMAAADRRGQGALDLRDDRTAPGGGSDPVDDPDPGREERRPLRHHAAANGSSPAPTAPRISS